MLPFGLLVLILIIAGVIARQGFLSAFLHFICVVSAGAIAFALWEPLTVAFLDSVGGFAAYLSGTTLVMVFLIALLVLRGAMDKLVPDNMNFEPAVEWVGATIFGLGGGLISIGILTIAVGFLQFTSGGFGYTGWARDQASGRPVQRSGVAMFPAALTARFYEFLSIGSFRPMIKPGPLKQFQPDIEQISWSLNRDSFVGKSGNSRVWIQPKAISIPADKGFIYSKDFSSTGLNPNFPNFRGAYIVPVEVNVSAFDNGSQFTLSATQARLIAPPMSSTSSADSAFPELFIQPTKTAPAMPFAFDDASNYVSSRPGTQDLQFLLVFPEKDLGPPIDGQYYLQLKQLRIPLPAVQVSDGGFATAMQGGQTQAPPTGAGRPLSSRDLMVKSEIPIRISYNAQGGLQVDDNNKITGGGGEFNTAGSSARVSKSNRITDFYEPSGTRIVQLLDRRNGTIDTSRLRRDGKGSEPLVLVDSTGQQFMPIGYIKKGPTKTLIQFNPSAPMASVDDIPPLPSSGNTELYIIFRAPIGSTLREVRVGDTPIASMSVKVQAEQ